MAFEFKLPDIGEGVHEGEIVQWLVKPGDAIQEDQALVEIMTDKVTAEIPSPVTGVIQELRGKEGEVIQVGTVIAVIDQQGAGAAAPKKAAAAPKEVAGSATDFVPTVASTPTRAVASTETNGKATAVMAAPARTDRVLAAPATRKLARQMGVDLSVVTGSGPRGRITSSDVKAFQGGGRMAARPGTFVSQGERREKFGGLRKKIAEHLVKSKQTAPHFAYVEEVDMTRLVQMREELLPVAEERGVKLTYLPFFIKAVIAGLRQYPVLNSQLDEAAQELVYKNDYHIGVAVATDQGLIVPVVKHADQKDLFALAAEIKTLADKARAGKLSLEDLKGGTFTLTSIGSIGGLFGVPIINYPEVAIMGINKIEKRPVVRNDQIVIRDIMHLSISCDHRVVDGAEAAMFVKEVIRYLENPTRILLAP